MKTINLSGNWLFSLNSQSLDDSISLPSTTAQAQKGIYNLASETGFLTENYPFEGQAWFSRKVKLNAEDLGQPIKLFLERTRITEVYVDGIKVTEDAAENEDSLCTPHIYNLTEYIAYEEFTLTICVSNTGYKTKGGHMTSPDTQTNWNGITGKIELIVADSEILSDIRVTTLDMRGNIRLDMEWENTYDTPDSLALVFKYYEDFYSDGEITEKEFIPSNQDAINRSVEIGTDKTSISLNLPLGETAKYWDEYNPYLYKLKVYGKDGSLFGEAYFGLRIWERNERNLFINGHPVFLRGKHDGCVFPITGACPTDITSWLKVMGTAKEYGINHYRYHTSCPPEAAFIAADLLGIYIEPELPFWGTIAAPGEEGFNEAEQEYLIEEGFRILKAFGNHPSFCFMSLGNELWGSSARMAEIIRSLRAYDDRHLYTQGSNNFQFVPCILPEDDFFVGVRFAVGQLIRGSYAMCDAPQGFVQTEKPNTVYNYDEVFLPYLAGAASKGGDADEEIEIQYGTGTKKVKATDTTGFKLTRPVVNHEIGQYCTYPDFKEIKKYTGVLRADNLKIFKERLEAAGLIDLAPDYFFASGKLAANCYKLELEAAHRSRFLSGYQILDLQDFPGQGTSLVGILDAFMDNKGIISKEDWRSFCSDMVVMAEIEDFVLVSGRTFDINVLVSCFRPSAIGENVSITWRLYEKRNSNINYEEVTEILIKSDDLDVTISEYGVTDVGRISIDVPEIIMPAKWRLELEISGYNCYNSYNLEVIPSTKPGSLSDFLAKDVRVTGDLREVIQNSREGKKTILFASPKTYIQGTYCTEFWNYPMFKGISEWLKRPLPIGTYGLLINADHAALSLFSSENYETPMWYEIVTDAKLSVLDNTNIRPIVRMMDNFERNHSLGLLWECSINKTPVLVCSQSPEKLMQSPEGCQFLKSIYCYVSTDNFVPMTELTEEEFIEVLEKKEMPLQNK